MSLLVLVAILCVGPAVGQVKVPCYGEGCANVTVYLGPRLGSRVIMIPRTNTSRPRVNSTDGALKPEGWEIRGDRFEQYDEGIHRAQHRPVPEDGKIHVDFMDEDPSRNGPTTQIPSRTTRSPYYQSNNRWPWWSHTTARRPLPFRTIPTNHPDHGIRVLMDKYWRGTVDLSWRGYTGEDVKEALMTLSEHDRGQVTKLVLEGNRIQYLPVLVFPVELEYGLQELRLNDNRFSPPYLSSYTRFELSRLNRLRTLNMSRCGLRSIEMPNLSSLEVLDLSHNDLTFLPTSLGRLSGLLQLYLRGNSLNFVSETPLSSLYNLWVLDLGSNGLEEIWAEPLEHLSSLVTLKLDNNRLTTLPLLDGRRTKIVFLANNTLQCSCSLKHWLSRTNVIIQDDFFERCQDGYNSIYLNELKAGTEGHQLCDQGWWAPRAWASVVLFYRRNPDIMSVIYKVVGVTFVVVVLVVLLRRRKRVLAKIKSKGIPYNILDEQQISTVSGPQSQA